MAIAIVKPFENRTIQNPYVFVRFSIGFCQNGGHLSGFQMIGLPISDPIQNLDLFQPELFFGHSKSRPVRISDPHCTEHLIIRFFWL